MTKEEALKLYESECWLEMSFEEKAKFQFITKRLCMPFNIFHEALEKTLGSPVFTHELGMNYEGIKKELFGGAEPPTMQEIIEMLPEDKRIIVTA